METFTKLFGSLLVFVGSEEAHKVASCWPPSAAQTARAVCPHAAFTKTPSSEERLKESIEQDSQAHTHRTTWFPAAASSYRVANA